MTTSSRSANESYAEVERIVSDIRGYTTMRPEIGIVCGSGLGTLAESIEQPTVIPYDKLTGFPNTTVSGHAGNLVFGQVSGKCVVAMQGRIHQYEGFHRTQMVLPIRVMKLLGVKTVLFSNAAGGLGAHLKVGDFVILKDHISLSGLSMGNVLIGPNVDEFGPRFSATSDAYDPKYRKLLISVANDLGMHHRVHEGVYFHIVGPTYGSLAECRMMIQLGADVVGMSTVPEVFVARHCGLNVVAVSLVTDICNPDVRKEALTHEEVLKAANKNSEDMKKLFLEFLKRL